MALSTLATSAKKTVSESLADSGEFEANYLRGDPPSETHKNAVDLAKWMGCGSSQILNAWMEGDMFKRTFDVLWKEVITVNKEAGNNASAQLVAVQEAIAKGQSSGEEKYSDPDANRTQWTDLDWYAWCLYTLTTKNMKNRQGIFFGKLVDASNAETRLWQAILREKYQRGTAAKQLEAARISRKRKSADGLSGISKKSSSTASPTPTSSQNRPPSRPKSELPPLSAFPIAPVSGGLSNEPFISSPDKAIIPSSASSGHSVRHGKVEEIPISASQTPTHESETTGSGRPSLTPMKEPEGSKPGRTSPNVSATDSAPEPEESSRPEPVLTPIQRLKLSANKDNLLDLGTDFGKYLVVALVCKHFTSTLEIERLKSQPETNPTTDAAAFNDLTEKHRSELEAIGAQMKFVHVADSTEDEIKESVDLEAHLNSFRFQPMDYAESVRVIQAADPDFPQIPGMNPSKILRGWQVTGIARIIQWMEDSQRGGVVADATGTGKTWLVLGFLLLRIYNRKKHEKSVVDWDRRNKLFENHVAQFEIEGVASAPSNEQDIPEPLSPRPVLPKQKPVLLLLMHHLISQWEGEMRTFSNEFVPLLYYGEKGNKVTPNLIQGLLSKDHSFFQRKNVHKCVVISTLDTLRARHGPSAQQTWHLQQGMPSQEAKDVYWELDPDWPQNLENCFDIVAIDEAHLIKNKETTSLWTITSLGDCFVLMATAHVLPNRLSDWSGYSRLLEEPDELWRPENLNMWKVTTDINPFKLPRDHPAAILQFTRRAITKYIIPQNSKVKLDEVTTGYNLGRVWERYMIRRSYAAKDPQNTYRLIGDAIPKLVSRRIVTKFTPEEQKDYDTAIIVPLRKLIRPLNDGSGRVVYNRKFQRQLELFSGWIYFEYIEAFVKASDMMKLKQQDHLLYHLIKLVFVSYKKVHDGEEPFKLPNMTDSIGLLAIACRGNPKLRAMIRIWQELVVLGRKKLNVWTGYPATQILLYAVALELRIPSACYSAELTQKERDKLVRSFTIEPDNCLIFIGSFYVGSIGLNLQHLSHRIADYDAPPNKAIAFQAKGRNRRIGATLPVEHFELSVHGSWQSTILSKTIEKAVPGIVAKLSIDTDDVKDVEYKDEVLDVGEWYKVGDELIRHPDPRLANVDPATKLTAWEYVTEIQRLQMGQTHLIEDGWEKEDNEELDIDAMVNEVELAIRQRSMS